MANSLSLYRSNHNVMVGGVLAGIAERYGWDASVVRITFVALCIFTASISFWMYFILWFLIPKRA